LQSHGWKVVHAMRLSKEPLPYREYIQRSRGEFTVAKDQNVRLRSGWFSDRSACYLAAGRPVITQDTGFGKFLPTGRGLFSFRTVDEIVAALDAITADYAAHSRAAREIAEEYFKAETVLARLLADCGV
jgi:glycosyltransferase involved in cell wall biosynthesis